MSSGLVKTPHHRQVEAVIPSAAGTRPRAPSTRRRPGRSHAPGADAPAGSPAPGSTACGGAPARSPRWCRSARSPDARRPAPRPPLPFRTRVRPSRSWACKMILRAVCCEMDLLIAGTYYQKKPLKEKVGEESVSVALALKAFAEGVSATPRMGIIKIDSKFNYLDFFGPIIKRKCNKDGFFLTFSCSFNKIGSWAKNAFSVHGLQQSLTGKKRYPCQRIQNDTGRKNDEKIKAIGYLRCCCLRACGGRRHGTNRGSDYHKRRYHRQSLEGHVGELTDTASARSSSKDIFIAARCRAGSPSSARTSLEMNEWGSLCLTASAPPGPGESPIEPGIPESPIDPARRLAAFRSGYRHRLPAFFDHPSEFQGIEKVNGADADILYVPLPLGGNATYFIDSKNFLAPEG